jgi:WD40 repeat protein
VLDTGGHHGWVQGLAFTPDGNYVVTAGEDKVVRIWDWRRGATVRIIRGEVAEGSRGVIYALAVSADGRYVAVGGLLAGTAKEDQAAIRVHDFQTGEVVAFLRGHTNSITGLAFSPQDSRYLVSASTDRTAALWDVQRSRRVRDFRGHSDRVFAVGFSPDGSRLVTASLDATVKIWRAQGGVQHTLRGHTDAVVTAEFTPDGRQVLSGSEDATIRTWNADSGKEEQTLKGLGTQMANLSVSPAGRRLLACFQTGDQADRRYPCQILSLDTGQPVLQFQQHQDAVRRTAFSRDGKLAATAGGVANEILVWDTASGKATRLAGNGLPMLMVGYAKDGRSIAFGAKAKAQPKVNDYGELQRRFLLDPEEGYRIGLGPPVTRDAEYLTSRTKYQAKNETYELRSVKDGGGDDQILQVIRNGSVRHRIERNETSGYRHTAYTFTHGGRYVISGADNGFLSLYETERGRKVLDFIGHTGSVWSVAVSPDNTTLVSGSEDQTIRVWDIGSGKNLLTIFVAADRDELDWVAWTPERYYTSSIHGGEYIGWHINRGVQRSARYVDVAELRGEFYRPDVVAEFLKLRDFSTAFQRANAAAGEGGARAPRSDADVKGILPPTVSVTSTASSSNTWRVAAEIASTLPITSVRVLHNGFLVSPTRIRTVNLSENRRSIEIDLPVFPGRNTVYVTASNPKSTARGDSEMMSAPPTVTPPRTKPNLYVLAVGVNRYRHMQPLRYAVQDAKAVVDLLMRQRNGLFRDVIAQTLLDDEATPGAIVGAIEKINRSAGEYDTRLVFLAGHGKTFKNRYHFLGSGHAGDSQKDALSWFELIGALTPGEDDIIKGRTILMVDTCRAAKVSDDPAAALLSTELGNGGGLVTFAAAASNQNSEESDAWGNGAFTKALLEALSTRPEKQSERVIFTDELGVRIRKGVMRLTQMQIPVSISFPLGMPPFPLFQLPER